MKPQPLARRDFLKTGAVILAAPSLAWNAFAADAPLSVDLVYDCDAITNTIADLDKKLKEMSNSTPIWLAEKIKDLKTKHDENYHKLSRELYKAETQVTKEAIGLIGTIIGTTAMALTATATAPLATGALVGVAIVSGPVTLLVQTGYDPKTKISGKELLTLTTADRVGLAVENTSSAFWRTFGRAMTALTLAYSAGNFVYEIKQWNDIRQKVWAFQTELYKVATNPNNYFIAQVVQESMTANRDYLKEMKDVFCRPASNPPADPVFGSSGSLANDLHLPS